MNPIRKVEINLILTHSGSSEVLKSAIDRSKVGDREKIEPIAATKTFAQ